MPNILVIESDPAVRDVLDEILSDEGYQVQLLEQHELQPCQVAASAWPDLVMLEITPIATAQTLSLVEELRHQPPTVHLPVVVCITDPLLLKRLDAELVRLGCASLLKPFELDGLLQLVRQQLDSTNSTYSVDHTPCSGRSISS